MLDNNTRIRSYVKEMKERQLLTYERLPDIELYMEQMLSFFDKILPELKTSFDDKIVTNSMINNYVRDNVIEKPVNKKYSKEQISGLIKVLLLKNSLSLDEIKQLFNNKNDYNEFCQKYDYIKESFIDSFNKRLDEAENDENKLYDILLDLAIERTISSLISQRLFKYLSQN